MPRPWSMYDGLTYFSAAHVAGLLLHPVIGWGRASTQQRALYYDPELPLSAQREQVIEQIAWHYAERWPAGSVVDAMRELQARILSC